MEAIDLTKVCEVKLTYKNKVKASERIKVNSSEIAAEVLRSVWDDETMEYQEHFKVILLNRANKVLGVQHLSSGSTEACMVDVKMIFTAALKAGASGVILAHNHPSGNLAPSQADKKITNKAVEGGKLLDITVMDHIILSSESFLSMADEGLMY